MEAVLASSPWPPTQEKRGLRFLEAVFSLFADAESDPSISGGLGVHRAWHRQTFDVVPS